MTDKKKLLIAGGVLLVCILAAVLSMPRFYRGDRIKLKVHVTGSNLGALNFDVQKPTGEADKYDVKVKGYSAEISAKADEYGTYSVIMYGAEYPVEFRIKKFDWFQRTKADIAVDFGDDECYFSVSFSATNGELPLREKYDTSGKAEKTDGKYVISL